MANIASVVYIAYPQTNAYTYMYIYLYIYVYHYEL